MSFSIGTKLKVTIFGQSHAVAVGVVLDGLPSGESIDLDELQAFMQRRAPGHSSVSSARQESDSFEVLSGLVNGRTCGAPLAMTIRNHDIRSEDYAKLRNVPRPSHADYPASVKYGDSYDGRGGGQFSGRLTAPLCLAGGVCAQFLKRLDIQIAAHIQSIAGIQDRPIDAQSVDIEALQVAAKEEIPALSSEAGKMMKQVILDAKAAGDSVGGVVECAAIGLPVGLGEPIFGSLESRLAAAIFAIPAVRGIEFGSGFDAAQMRGSRHNDPYALGSDGQVVTTSNHHGGILGGLSTGMPLILRVAFKPTPSIDMEQQSVDLVNRCETSLSINGRHDPCIVPRAVPCVEAATAIVLMDATL
ncbi:MAG: chorismate synthase [Coriobacteriales bacterium]|jgi:chorismate synthase|nr:chorismate synthase [Coriobacteriales bacterium]